MLHLTSCGLLLCRLIWALAVIALAGCATPAPSPGPPVVLGRGDHDRVIRAERGQLLEIRLPAAAPGGPRWDIDRLDGPLVLAAEPRFEPASDGQRGGSGTTVFLIRCARPGQAMVRLVYRHPWEQAVKGETFLAMVHVR